MPDDEAALTADIIAPAKQHGRYGDRRVTALLHSAGWVRSYDFVEARTHEGRKFRMLCLIDEFTREALAVRVRRKLNSTDVLEVLADVMICRGTPQ